MAYFNSKNNIRNTRNNNANRNFQNANNRLSDRDMALDLLQTEKSMSHLYEQATIEASNDNIRHTFEQLQQDEHQHAHKLFDTMDRRNWYMSNASVGNNAFAGGHRGANHSAFRYSRSRAKQNAQSNNFDNTWQ